MPDPASRPPTHDTGPPWGERDHGLAAAGEPVFQAVLGAQWDSLGAVVRRHYFLRPWSDDAITVRGVMEEVHHSAIAKLLIPFGRLFGGIVPYRGAGVPIEVHYSAKPRDSTIHWDRVFRFPGRAPFHFRSHMAPRGPNQVVEFVRFGLGVRLAVTAEDGALVFRDRGYVWRMFGRDVPMPVGLLLGRAYIEERPVDDRCFTMRLAIAHPVFGEIFRYSGRFSLPDG